MGACLVKLLCVVCMCVCLCLLCLCLCWRVCVFSDLLCFVCFVCFVCFLCFVFACVVVSVFVSVR